MKIKDTTTTSNIMGIYTDLSLRLTARGIRTSAYRINVFATDNTYCIQDSGEHIEVFYSERGGKYDLKTFTDAQEAIAYFEQWIAQDATVFVTM